MESAVYALAREVVSDGHPVLQRFGVSDNDAFAVGLACAGSSTSSSRRYRSKPSQSWPTSQLISRPAARWRSPQWSSIQTPGA